MLTECEKETMDVIDKFGGVIVVGELMAELGITRSQASGRIEALIEKNQISRAGVREHGKFRKNREYTKAHFRRLRLEEKFDFAMDNIVTTDGATKWNPSMNHKHSESIYY